MNTQKSISCLSTINKREKFLDIYDHIKKYQILRDKSNTTCLRPLPRKLLNIMKT